MKDANLQFVRKLWPLACGLIVGGLLGGISQSWSVGLLVGLVSWGYFVFEINGGGAIPSDDQLESSAQIGVVTSGNSDHDAPPRTRIVGAWDAPDPADASQLAQLHGYGAAGIGTFAHLYEDEHD